MVSRVVGNVNVPFNLFAAKALRPILVIAWLLKSTASIFMLENALSPTVVAPVGISKFDI